MSKGCGRVFRVRIGRCLVGAPSMLTKSVVAVRQTFSAMAGSPH